MKDPVRNKNKFQHGTFRYPKVNTALRISLLVALSLAGQMTFAQNSIFVTTGNRNDDLPAFKYANIDSAADFQQYRKSAEASIASNKRILDQLKVRKTKGDNESRTKFRNQVSELEEKNEEMAMRMAIADLMATRNWPAFKRNFTKEMTELTTSVRNLADIYFVDK